MGSSCDSICLLKMNARHLVVTGDQDGDDGSVVVPVLGLDATTAAPPDGLRAARVVVA